jgi:hypothetical protein
MQAVCRGRKKVEREEREGETERKATGTQL